MIEGVPANGHQHACVCGLTRDPAPLGSGPRGRGPHPCRIGGGYPTPPRPPASSKLVDNLGRIPCVRCPWPLYRLSFHFTQVNRFGRNAMVVALSRHWELRFPDFLSNARVTLEDQFWQTQHFAEL